MPGISLPKSYIFWEAPGHYKFSLARWRQLPCISIDSPKLTATAAARRPLARKRKLIFNTPEGRYRFFLWKLRMVASWATKRKRHLFPLNPGCLLGIRNSCNGIFLNPIITKSGIKHPFCNLNNQGPFLHCSTVGGQSTSTHFPTGQLIAQAIFFMMPKFIGKNANSLEVHSRNTSQLFQQLGQ